MLRPPLAKRPKERRRDPPLEQTPGGDVAETPGPDAFLPPAGQEPGSSSRGVRCEAGYTILVLQVSDDPNYDLWGMYAPAREPLVAGLKSRARECGYAVRVAENYGADDAVSAKALDALTFGDAVRRADVETAGACPSWSGAFGGPRNIPVAAIRPESRATAT